MWIEAMSWAATTGGHSSDVVRDVMLAAVENRFGSALNAPTEIEWLTDNGSGYTADKTRAFASAIGSRPLTTPVCSPQSNSMAERFVKTMKRDYIAFIPKPDVETAGRNLAIALEHYNEQHPQ
jgi:putative transposase